MIPQTVNIKETIKSHPLVVKRLGELSNEIPHYQQWSRWCGSDGKTYYNSDNAYKLRRLESERDGLLIGGPISGETQKGYLERCASVFIEAVYQLEQKGDNDSAEHKRLERYLESINAQLSAPNVSVNVRQTVNILVAMGIFT